MILTVKRKEKNKHYLDKYGLNEHIRKTSVLYIHLIHSYKKREDTYFFISMHRFLSKMYVVIYIYYLNIKKNNYNVF